MPKVWGPLRKPSVLNAELGGGALLYTLGIGLGVFMLIMGYRLQGTIVFVGSLALLGARVVMYKRVA